MAPLKNIEEALGVGTGTGDNTLLSIRVCLLMVGYDST